MEHIRDTISLCPVCRKRIPAGVVEDGGSIYMEKKCPEHGFFRSKIAKYSHYYKDFMHFYEILSRHFPYDRSRIESCNFSTTLKCNLHCPICFAGDRNRMIPGEEPLSSIREKLRLIEGRRVNFVLTGGEPTMRQDLPEIIELVRKSGNFPKLITNGLKLVDVDYLAMLKRKGLSAVATFIDAVEDGEAYVKLRGQNLLELKRQVLENIRKVNLPLQIFFALTRGLNEGEIENILNLAARYPNIFKITFLGYMHRGRKGLSEENEYTADEIWETIVRHSPVFSSLEEFYLGVKLILFSRAIRNMYSCYNAHFLLMPRTPVGKNPFDFRKYSQIFSRADELLERNPRRFKRIFIRNYVGDLVKAGFRMPLLKRALCRGSGPDEIFVNRKYFWIQFETLYYPRNYDEYMVRNFCPNLAFNPGLEKRISFCEYYNVGLKT